MSDQTKPWAKELRYWIGALGTTAAAIISVVALLEAISANDRSLRVLNDDKTPWLSIPVVGWGVDTSPACPTPRQYALNLTIENTGGGPALDADLSASNSLGHAGKAKKLALMPGTKSPVTVCYEEKARDRQQLREWLDSAYRPPDAWFAIQLKYRRLDGQTYVMVDTGYFANVGFVAWRGLAIREVRDGESRGQGK